jgi:TRAP-type C4-dicarboxylate transport system substrate-binding protein
MKGLAVVCVALCAVDRAFHRCVPFAHNATRHRVGRDAVVRVARWVWIGMFASSTALSASAATARELRVADSFPAGHYLVRLLLKPWMDDVTKRTNGAVTFAYFPAQQLGKATDLLRMTQAGVIDIGYIAPSYASDKMPVSEVAQLPGMFDTACAGTLAYWKVARGGLVEKYDYAPNKIRLLLEVALPPYHIFTARQVIQSDKDVQGLKLRTTGGAQDLTLRSIGAVPVRMAAPEAYESLSRGTLDGLLFPIESVISYGVDKLVKHATEGTGFASFIVAFSINQNVWNSLPPDVQKAMNDAAEELEPKMCREVDEEEVQSRKKLEDGGVAFEPLPNEARETFRGLLKSVGTTWAAGLDARGKDGTAVLNEFQTALKTQAN